MNDYYSGGDAESVKFDIARLFGGVSLGTIHEQRFYAIRANGENLRFPFSTQPFTAMVDISRPVGDEVLASYANSLIAHGCVQAICRGEDSDRLVDIFNGMADQGDFDRNGRLFTSMCLGDEPLAESIQYFVLPSGLAQTGLLMVIGEAEDFQDAIEDFSTAAGAIREDLGHPVYTDANLACFVSS